MNAFARSFSAALFCSLATFAVAQAPIVRQPPPTDQPITAPNYEQMAQQDQQPPAPLPPDQLDALVNRIALYPDPLLAQVLTAATYWDEIPDAATWANEHSSINGDALNAAMQADNLPWDPSVLALLPFPTVLQMMAGDPDWTGQLGNAFLVQPDDVMDSVQRLRNEAYGYGYLASNSDIDVIDDGGDIQIQPYNPYFYYVPVYDPLIVFFPPRSGYFVGGALRYRYGVVLGPSFARFGWFGAGFGWREHTVLIDHRPWTRTFTNRNAYVPQYSHPYVRPAAPQTERHETTVNRASPQSRPAPPSNPAPQYRPAPPSNPAPQSHTAPQSHASSGRR